MSIDYTEIRRSLNEITRLMANIPLSAKKELILTAVQGARSKLDMLQCKTSLGPEERWLVHRELEETMVLIINVIDFF